MKFCACALPAINGNSDCCENCPNNNKYEISEFEFDIKMPKVEPSFFKYIK